MKKFIFVLETGERNPDFRTTYRIKADDLHEAINILCDTYGKEYGSTKRIIKNTEAE